MAYLFVLLNVADAVLTAIGIYRGKEELNPLVSWLMGQIGLLATLVLVKAVTIAVVLAVARRIRLLLPFACVVMGGAVLWNASVLAS